MNNLKDTMCKRLVRGITCYVGIPVTIAYIEIGLYFQALSWAGEMAHIAPTEDPSPSPNPYTGLFTTTLNLAPRRSDASDHLRYLRSQAHAPTQTHMHAYN